MQCGGNRRRHIVIGGIKIERHCNCGSGFRIGSAARSLRTALEFAGENAAGKAVEQEQDQQCAKHHAHGDDGQRPAVRVYFLHAHGTGML